MHRLLRFAIVMAAGLGALAGMGPTTARADSSLPPQVIGIAPLVLVPNGQPFHLTLTGSNLSGVTEVFLNPVVADRSFAVAGDSTVRLTLPATLPPGDYAVSLSSTAGASDPGAAEFTVGTAPAPVQPAAAAPAPQYSFAPIPRAQYQPTTGVVSPIAPSAVASAGGHPLNPLVLLPLGIVLGGLGYLLWGRPGRLAAAGSEGLAAHLVGRPAQALKVGRICLQCRRLHFVLRTRRDLWRAGHFCSATCFVAAQEDDSAALAGETTAVTRMREMFVYSELEKGLQEALAGDVHILEHAAAVGDPHIEAMVAPTA